MNEKFSKLGFYPADILLPNKDVDMEKWAVVACDQFTSEPEYWERVEKTVGDAPSTLRLILPEANLKAPNVDEYIADINASMDKYLADGVFQVLPESLVYIERQQSDGQELVHDEAHRVQMQEIRQPRDDQHRDHGLGDPGGAGCLDQRKNFIYQKRDYGDIQIV